VTRHLLASFRAAPIVKLLGAKLRIPSAGRAEVRVPFRRATLQATGVVHGSIIGFAADTAGYFAAASTLDGPAATSEFKIHFLAPLTGACRAVGRVVRRGRRLVVTEMRTFDGRGRLISIALGTYVPIGGEVSS